MGIVEELSDLIRDPQLEQLELALAKPNLFEILRIAHIEIRHSNFLAWLLDPTAGHNLGDRFLRWFLKDIFSDQKIPWTDEFAVDQVRTDDVSILREFKGIDLLLKAESFVMVIENKVWSGEQSDQLRKYIDTVAREFPDHQHAFVFLTPYGDEPRSTDNGSIYINYDYSALLRILEIILDTYADSMSARTKLYAEDYVATIRRHIMKEDEAIAIARQIYDNHREALDFIIENKPDRMIDVAPVFLAAIKDAGYIPETQNKGYAGLLTKRLHDIVPRSGTQGWKNNEAFLFQIDYWNKNTTLKCVVSPGNATNRQALVEALQNVGGAKKPRTNLWSTVHSHPHRIDVYDERYEDLEELKKDLDKMFETEKDFIQSVEDEIIAVSEHFVENDGT